MSFLRRALVVSAATFGLTVAIHSPAYAVVTASGGQFSCMPGHPVTFTAHGSGEIKFYYPSNGSAKSVKGPFSGIVYATYTTRVYTVTSWKISATGYLDAQETGVGCAA